MQQQLDWQMCVDLLVHRKSVLIFQLEREEAKQDASHLHQLSLLRVYRLLENNKLEKFPTLIYIFLFLILSICLY